MTIDLISDMLTRIRNGSLARHTFVYIPFSKINVSILEVLKKENYITTYQIEFKEKQKYIKAFLKYNGIWMKMPYFSQIYRISKPGQRVFSGYKTFTKRIDLLRYNQGIAIISTSSGIMSHKKAIQLKKGGEIICYIE